MFPAQREFPFLLSIVQKVLYWDEGADCLHRHLRTWKNMNILCMFCISKKLIIVVLSQNPEQHLCVYLY